MNAFRYLGLQTLDQVDYMTLQEYQLRMKAYALIRLDKEHDLHKQAYLNMVVQGTRERGGKSVPIYPTFDKFFNQQPLEDAILGNKQPKKEDRHSEIKHLILLANTKGGTHE